MTLTRAEYDAWQDRHAALFGFNHPNDPATFEAWHDLFAAVGYTAADLAAATDEIARRTEPLRWRDDHLAAIHAAVRDRRRLGRSYRDPAEVDDDIGTCVLCGDSGCVVVPHPRGVSAGQWVRGWEGVTAAVTCSCWKGRRQQDLYDDLPPAAQKRRPRQMSLEHYQARVCPNWRALLADHEAKLAAHRKAEAASRRADDAGGPLAGAVRRVVAARGDER